MGTTDTISSEIYHGHPRGEKRKHGVVVLGDVDVQQTRLGEHNGIDRRKPARGERVREEGLINGEDQRTVGNRRLHSWHVCWWPVR